MPTREAGHAAALDLLAGRGPRPTATACYNDTMALGVLLALRAADLAPSRDVAVSGYDNVAEAGLWVPGLTSVDVPRRELRRRTA